MIKFENAVLPSAEQWRTIILGSRNPLNSWNRSDSKFLEEEDLDPNDYPCKFKLGPNDYDLLRRLAAGGSTHAKYRRMITVYVDITAPLYFWKEADTYRMGVEKNSCSTMHKIHAKEFTLEDFSCEHLLDEKDYYEVLNAENEYPKMEETDGNDIYYTPKDFMEQTIYILNFYRQKYLETKDKKYWWQMIQLLPSSYNQKRTVMLNYEVLAHIWNDRRMHKLDEWAEHTKTVTVSIAGNTSTVKESDEVFGFCDWIKTLPYSELITQEEALVAEK